MIIVNLTGHLVQLETDSGYINFPSKGRARVTSRPFFVDDMEISNTVHRVSPTIPRYIQSERRIIDLPDPDDGVLYIVSGIVADVAQRDDVWAIGRKSAENGGVVRGRALIRFDRIGLHGHTGHAEETTEGAHGQGE